MPERSSMSPADVEAVIRKGVRTAIADMLWMDTLPSLGSKTSLAYKPGFDTACWFYSPPHNIVIGLDIFGHARAGLDEEERARYAGAFFHHEHSHALWTERNMKTVTAALKKLKCPFSLFNLFEDARIEHRRRMEPGFKFDWLRFEEEAKLESPGQMYFSLIQAEGAVSSKVAALPSTEAGVFAEVRKFYERSIAAPDSLSLFPILEDWIKRFGAPPEEDGGGSGFAGGGELSLSAALAQDGTKAKEFLADTKPDADGVPTGALGILPVTPIGPPTRGEFLTRNTGAVDTARADAVAKRMERYFADKSRMVSTETPQRKVSARHFALDRPPFRKKEVTAAARKRVLFVFDCSGSMSGPPATEGKVIVAALSRLARRGFVEGTVVFSRVRGAAQNQAVRLPLSDEEVSRIPSDGGAEGLHAALTVHQRLAQEADHVFVYTDAAICDTPLSRHALHAKGIFTWGLYCGETSNLESVRTAMLVYFDRQILRSTAFELVDAMLAQIRA